MSSGWRGGGAVLLYVVEHGVRRGYGLFCPHDSALRLYRVTLIASVQLPHPFTPVPITIPNPIPHVAPCRPRPRPDGQIRAHQPRVQTHEDRAPGPAATVLEYIHNHQNRAPKNDAAEESTARVAIRTNAARTARAWASVHMRQSGSVDHMPLWGLLERKGRVSLGLGRGGGRKIPVKD